MQNNEQINPIINETPQLVNFDNLHKLTGNIPTHIQNLINEAKITDSNSARVLANFRNGKVSRSNVNSNKNKKIKIINQINEELSKSGITNIDDWLPKIEPIKPITIINRLTKFKDGVKETLRPTYSRAPLGNRIMEWMMPEQKSYNIPNQKKYSSQLGGKYTKKRKTKKRNTKKRYSSLKL
jgi:hypothetical protein